ncbi:glycosyltransferase family 117 protein [Fibrobacter intestinalis]
MTAGLAAVVAFIVYAMTMAPTVSFWDCGEFIACSNILGIPHPPGTPFFVLLSRAVILALPFVEEIAKRVNYISVFCSAATVFVTSLFAWDFLAKILSKDSLVDRVSAGFRKLILFTAALTAGTLLTFSDTFWFNAVEAEVYGFAMFIVMLVSYLAFKWLDHKDDGWGNRILIFICYIAFVGVGAHLYTLLTIPAVFALLLLAEPKKIVSRIPVWITGTLLCSVIYAVSSFIAIAIASAFVLGVLVLARVGSPEVKKSFRLSFAFALVALLGYSSHLYLPIRSELNPAIDENDPEINFKDEQGNLQLGNLLDSKNWKSFNDFVERKQYGSESMLSRAMHRRARTAHQFLSFPNMGYGGYQIAQYLPFKVGGVSFGNGTYVFDPSENEPLERFGFYFPTQMQLMGDNVPAQLIWFLLFNGAIVAVCVFSYRRSKKLGVYLGFLYALCSFGLLFYVNFADGTRMDSSRDFNYWKSAMESNVRDLKQAGISIPSVPNPNALIDARQNIEHAKMALNTLRYRNASASEISAAEQKLHALESAPIWQSWKLIEAAYAKVGRRAPFPETVHIEVRERDYFYTPAFIFMSLIFGVGVGILVYLLAIKASAFAAPVAVAFIAICSVIPCISNYREHDRSGLWVPWDYAYNLLMSCRPNAILFTNGDNDTFPLWFAQQVAGVRKDVRVVNLSLGNTDWYIKQMLTQEPILKLSYDKEGIEKRMAIGDLNERNPEHYTQTWIAKADRAIPALQSRIANMTDSTGAAKPDADTLKLKQYRVMLQVYSAFKEWQAKSHAGLMLTQYKLVLDLAMNNVDRPLHFSTTVGQSNFMGLEKYMVQEGMIFNLMQGDTTDRRSVNQDFDLERTAYLIDSVYKFRGLGDGTAYIDGETTRLLSSYTSLYLQIAFQVRENIVALLQNAPLTTSKKQQIDALVEKALHFLDKGIAQFPEEWRCYWAASYILEPVREKKRALEYLDKGLKNVSVFDEQGRARLEINRQSFESMPDMPLAVVPDSVAVSDSSALPTK